MRDMENAEVKIAAWCPTFKNDILAIASGRKFGVLTLSNNTLSFALTDGSQEFSASGDDVKSFRQVNPVTGNTENGDVLAFVLRLKDKRHYLLHLISARQDTQGTIMTPEDTAKAYAASPPTSMPGNTDKAFSEAIKQWAKANRVRSGGIVTTIITLIVVAFFAYAFWKMLHR